MVAFPETGQWRDFLARSAELGQDIALVQAAGGNTSLKLGDTLWIKASGTWLAEAETRAIMVPVELAAMRARIDAGDLQESEISGMTGTAPGMAGMRASVETPFHALMDAPCVSHVHCVATIAHAISEDAESRLSARLEGLDWVWQPYIKPGVPLTNALRDAGAATAEIVVLGNHGLIATGETPEMAQGRLRRVQDRLRIPVPEAETEFRALDVSLAGCGYRPAPPGRAHLLAQREDLAAIAGNCAFAPDFVVFFGPDIPVVSPGPHLADTLAELAAPPGPMNAVVLVLGHGALIRETAMRGTAELLSGYHLVLEQLRASGGGEIRFFSEREVDELLGWDAEKYRQSMNQGGTDRSR